MASFSKLSPDLRSIAVSVSPAIRASLRQSNGAFPRVKFIPDTGLTSYSFSQKVSVVDLPGCYLGDISDSLENIYERLSACKKSDLQDQDTFSFGIGGLGSFTASCVHKSPAGRTKGRLWNKVAVITGSAQGIGKGIALEIASQGASVVIADINLEKANSVASMIQAEYGKESAIALAVDVSSEKSIQEFIQEAVFILGGIDLFVSNVGVLIAGGLDEMDLQTFEFVTRINYTAFFLCAKYAAIPMRIQFRFANDWYGDIIQINSKSGLEGSNHNFAYAGSKFGGIGLVQSYAKELVEFNIKVNAVCPGNYFDGPLWSDPEKGLFVQYLNTNKVPGASSVKDVYDFYINKVPMKKGCTPHDIAIAIFYLVEQLNETGQALPVTGGQNMLH